MGRKGDGDGRCARLDLYQFRWRNWDFDRKEVIAQNADTSMHI